MALRAMGLVGIRMISVAHLVEHVFRRSAPVQVLQAVVVRVVITVAAMHGLGPRADKGLQHEYVDRHRSALSLPKQGASVIPTSWPTAADLRLRQHLALKHLRCAPSALNFPI